MTEERPPSLGDLQVIDLKMRTAKVRIVEFEPLLEQVAEPFERLEVEAEQLRKRLTEMRLDERKLERGADEKRQRMERLQERLNSVRNLREEAAVHTEVDLVRRALEGDEQEALNLLDQIRRSEERLAELDAAVADAKAELEPKRADLQSQRTNVEEELKALQAARDALAARVDQVERRVYEQIISGGRRLAVAAMTEDGACGSCFSMITLQIQIEIRRGARMNRCEACGVILLPPAEAVAEESEATPVAVAADDAPAEGAAAPESDEVEGDDLAGVEEDAETSDLG